MLRELRITDADNMLEWMHDADIQKSFQKSMMTKTKDDVISFIKTASTIAIEGGDAHFAIVDDNDEYLGTISLKKIDLSSLNAEYAISLRKKAQGRGYASYATRELLKIAFEQFGLKRVYLNVYSDNIRAIRLYEKCGFIYEGEFRNHLVVNDEFKSLRWYGILKNEYLDFINKDISN